MATPKRPTRRYVVVNGLSVNQHKQRLKRQLRLINHEIKKLQQRAR